MGRAEKSQGIGKDQKRKRRGGERTIQKKERAPLIVKETWSRGGDGPLRSPYLTPTSKEFRKGEKTPIEIKKEKPGRGVGGIFSP